MTFETVHGTVEHGGRLRRFGHHVHHQARHVIQDPVWRGIATHGATLGALYAAGKTVPHLQAYGFRRWRTAAMGRKLNASPWRKTFITQLRNSSAAKRAARHAFRKDQPEAWARGVLERKGARFARWFARAGGAKPFEEPGRIRRWTEAITTHVKSPTFRRNAAIGLAGLAGFELGRRYLKHRRQRSSG